MLIFFTAVSVSTCHNPGLPENGNDKKVDQRGTSSEASGDNGRTGEFERRRQDYLETSTLADRNYFEKIKPTVDSMIRIKPRLSWRFRPLMGPGGGRKRREHFVKSEPAIAEIFGSRAGVLDR